MTPAVTLTVWAVMVFMVVLVILVILEEWLNR